jgi:hypothetical protein
MKQTIDISLNLENADETAYYVSPKTGKKYLNASVLIREEKGKYGYDGFVVQKISKERKAAGEKGPILGNAKIMDWDAPKPPSEHQQAKANAYQPQGDDLDYVPF